MSSLCCCRPYGSQYRRRRLPGRPTVIVYGRSDCAQSLNSPAAAAAAARQPVSLTPRPGGPAAHRLPLPSARDTWQSHALVLGSFLRFLSSRSSTRAPAAAAASLDTQIDVCTADLKATGQDSCVHCLFSSWSTHGYSTQSKGVVRNLFWEGIKVLGEV